MSSSASYSLRHGKKIVENRFRCRTNFSKSRSQFPALATNNLIPMNEFDAFRRAVEIHRDGGWNPSRPNRPTLQAGKDYHTIHSICSLVMKCKMDMPDETVDDLVKCVQTRYPELATQVKNDRSFSTGARCLIMLMNDHRVMASIR